MKTIRCTDCRAEFTSEEIKFVSCCPACQSQATPMSISDDVSIKINLHELRILGIWAYNYATRCDDEQQDNPSRKSARATLQSILAPIHEQLKALGKDAPLTLEEELSELRRSPFVGSAELFQDGKPVVTLEEQQAVDETLRKIDDQS